MAKTKKNGFVAFIITYSLLLIGLIVAGLIYVWNLLIDYEASIPDVNMEKHLAEFAPDKIGSLIEKYPFTVNEYDSVDYAVSVFIDWADNGELSFAKLTGSYTNATPVYEVFSGNRAIARVDFSETGKNDHGFAVWEMSNVSFEEYGPDTYDITIKVPHKATVLINGNTISEDYSVTKEEKVPLTDNIAEYVAKVPSYKFYEITGLYGQVDVDVTGDAIKPVEGSEYSVEYTFDTDDALKQAVSGRITAMAREYGAYIINKGSLGALKSYMTGKAAAYVSDIPAIWAYLWGEEYSYSFTDEKIENFVKYSDECFSCDVSFTLRVTYRGTRNISYDTALSCMYIKKNGQWYLADFALK